MEKSILKSLCLSSKMCAMKAAATIFGICISMTLFASAESATDGAEEQIASKARKQELVLIATFKKKEFDEQWKAITKIFLLVGVKPIFRGRFQTYYLSVDRAEAARALELLKLADKVSLRNVKLNTIAEKAEK